MQFSSRNGADLPWRAGQEVTVHPVTVDGKPASVVVRDRPQHNPTNPILAAFREREWMGNIYARRQWRNFLREGWDQSICKATAKEEAHAHAVFERWDEIARHHALDELLAMEEDA